VTSRQPWLLALFSALLLVPAPAPAAKPKGGQAGGKPPACGMSYIPVVEGNTWAYKSNLGKVIVVRIVSVGQGKDAAGRPATIIEADEQYEGRALKTQWTCTPDKGLVVPPDSMFFAAEPGGGIGDQMTITAHEHVTLQPDATLVQDANWVEIIKADVARTDTSASGATHLPAKVELDRHVIVHNTENVATAVGQWNALKIGFELRGRGIVGDEVAEIPAKGDHPGTLWVVKGLGIVRMQDNFDKTWDLAESNLLK
jgi:hypothetical protein